ATEEMIDCLVAANSQNQESGDASNGSGAVPIFIVGMYRSGTTLLEQLLANHPEVKGLGELYDFTSQMRYATDHHCRGFMDRELVERAQSLSLAEVGDAYLNGVAWRLGSERCFIDKMPPNFL